jgi:glutamyl-tRNA synthetase
MVNMLARLGWSKGDKEIFYLDDLINDFRMQEVQKAGAVFDIKKLDWINNNHLANLDLEAFIEQLKPFLKNENIILESKDNWREIISHLRTSSSTLASISKDLIPYFLDIQTYDQKSVEKFIIGSKPTLEFVFRQLELIEAWNEDQLDDALTKCQRDLDLKTPQLNQPIRVALVGTTKSPSLGLTLSLVGKEVALARIKKAIELNDQE